MGLYPYNTNWGPLRAQTEVPGLFTRLGVGVCYAAGELAGASDAYFVADGAMQNAAYTLKTSFMPEVNTARKLLITVTQKDGVDDTMGTLTIVGTDIAGVALTETIAPTAAGTKLTVNAFATVASITGAGWARNGAAGSEDFIKIGTSKAFGLPDRLIDPTQVIAASINNVREATHPVVTADAVVLAANTVTLDTALNGSLVKVYYWI